MRIKKAPPEGKSSPHRDINEFIDALEKAGSDHDVGRLLQSALPEWRWPRTDLQYWIKVLNRLDDILAEICASYDLKDGNVQLNEFTPKTKELLLAILNFTRILLEHSTNKRTWNGYDRINDMMLTRDLDVLDANLRLALRPALLYKRTDSSAQERLLQLAQGWNTREYGFDMAALASDTTQVPPELEQATFQFYRQADASPTKGRQPQQPPATPAAGSSSRPADNTGAAAQGEGLVSLQLGNVAHANKDVIDIFADAVETHRVPLQAQLGLLQRLRITAAISDPPRRHALLVIRLHAIACLIPSAHSESVMQSKFFVYEPELVPQIAQLLHPDHDIKWSIRTAAVYALDALFKARSKSTEVHNSVNVSVSHGILLTLLRKAVEDVASPSPQISTEFLDALFVFLNSIQAQQNTGTMLINAGVIPILIELTKTAAHAGRTKLTSRSVTLLDSLVYGFNPATNSFLQHQGMNVFVDLLGHLVDSGIQRADALKSQGQEPHHSPTNGLLPHTEGALLRALLRCIARVMGITGTQGELRNLIDSSLPKTLKKIIENGRTCGPQIYSLALNIMTSFIHNEPTSLSILQEQSLPEAFYASVLGESELDPAFDVFNSLPNAIGALCLNDAGREQLRARSDVLPRLFYPFTSERHAKMLCERENASLYGAAIDELVRHQPELKEQVINCMVDMLRKLVEIGQTYQAPYQATAELTLVDPTQETPSTTAVQASASDDVQMGDAGMASTTAPPDEKKNSKKDSNPPLRSLKAKDNAFLAYIDAAGRFLEGFVQTQSHAKDFSKTDGIDLTCQLASLPCIPPNFEETSAATSLTTFLKALSDTTPAPVLTSLTKSVQSALAGARFLWDSPPDASRLGSLLAPDSPDALTAANRDCAALMTFQISCSILECVFPHLAYTHSRGTITQALQILNGCPDALESTPSSESLLLLLGKMHRRCLREQIILKLQFSENAGPERSGPEPEQQQPQQEANTDASSSSAVPISPALGLAGSGAPQPSSSSTSKHNWTLIKETMAATNACLESFFGSVIGRPPPRRNPDLPYHKQAVLAAQSMAKVMTDHLDVRPSENSMVDIACATVAIKAVSSMLSREKWVVASSASLLVCFEKEKGVERLLHLYGTFLESASTTSSHEVTSGDSEAAANAEPKLRLLQAFGGLRTSLDLLERLSISKMPETIPAGRFAPPEPDNFDSGVFLVRVRLAMLPKLVETWHSQVIKTAPPNLVRILFRTIVNILDAQGEDGSNASEPTAGRPAFGLPSLASLARRPPAPPSADRIQQIVDMGFPRAAASAALQRFSSNVHHATEYLVSHPDFVATHSHDEGTATPAEQAQSAETAGTESSTNQDQQMDVEPSELPEAAPPGDSALTSEQLRDALNRQRSDIRASFLEEAIQLIGNYKPLVFDLQEACHKLEPDTGSNADQPAQPDSKQLLGLLVSKLASRDLSSGPTTVETESAITSELRLLALLTKDRVLKRRVEAHLERIASVALQYLQSITDVEKPPSWLSLPLLITENVFALTEAPQHTELATSTTSIPSVDASALLRGPDLPQLRERAFDLSLSLCRASKCSDDDLNASLRIMALLTRRASFAQRLREGDILASIVAKTVNSNGENCQEFLILVLRHIVELPAILTTIIRSDIRHWLQRQRGRAVDMSSFVLGNKHAALRDPSIFASATFDLCQLHVATAAPETVTDGPFHVELIHKESNDEAPGDADSSQSQQQPGAGPAEGSQEASQVSNETAAVPLDQEGQRQIDGVIHLLMSQLLSLHKVISVETASAPPLVDGQTEEDASKAKEAIDSLHKRWLQVRFYMASLAELLYSYEACKASFVRFNHTDGDFLSFLLTSIIADGDTSSDKKHNPIKAVRVKEWAGLVLVALCGSSSSPFADEASQARSTAEEQEVRKVVLKAVDKAMASSLSDSTTTSQKYGRLSALAECSFCLLTGTAPSSQHTLRKSKPPSHEVNEEMAKLMLELSLPSTLTSALADVDLNFPHVRGLVNRILRPLQVLSRVARRAGPPKSAAVDQEPGEGTATTTTGRPEQQQQQQPSEDSESDDTEASSDMDMHARAGDQREEMPDVYRNSALGMYQGELEVGPTHPRYGNSGGGDGDDEDMLEEDDIMDEDDMVLDDGAVAEDLAPSDESDLTDEEELEHDAEHHPDHTMEEDDEDEDDDDGDDDDDNDDANEEDDDDSASDESDPDDGQDDDHHHHHHRHDGAHFHLHHQEPNEVLAELEMDDGADPMMLEMDDMEDEVGSQDMLDVLGGGGSPRLPGGDSRTPPVLLDLEVPEDGRPTAIHHHHPEGNDEDASDDDDADDDAGDDEGEEPPHGDDRFEGVMDDEDVEDDDDDDVAEWEEARHERDGIFGGGGIPPPLPRDLLRMSFDNSAGLGRLTTESGRSRGAQEPRPVLLSGQGQSVRDVSQHPQLVDSGMQQQDMEPETPRHRQLARGPYAHILSQIGDELGENAFSLFESVLGSVSTLQPHAQYQLLTQDGQVAANLRLDAPHRRGGRQGRAELHISDDFHGLAAAPGGAGPSSSGAAGPPRPSPSTSGLAPASTFLRWDQESRTFQGAASNSTRTGLLVVVLINALLPRAVKEAERQKQAEEERRAQEAERAATQKAEKEQQEKEAQEQKQKEEQEAAHKEQQQQQHQPETTAPTSTSDQPPASVDDTANAMQGVSVDDPLAEVMALARSLGNPAPPVSAPTAAVTASSEAPSATAMSVDEAPQTQAPASQPDQAVGSQTQPLTSSQPEASPVTIQIHGSTVDITNTGIDPTFLEALPDDMREEVVSQHFRENAAAAAASSSGTSQANQRQQQQQPSVESAISREFLDALPPDIREEVIQQEAAEQGRQERSRGTARNAEEPSEEGAALGPIDMDAASFLATLVDEDPELRREVLMQQIEQGGEGFMGTLPPGLFTEARGLQNPGLAVRQAGPPPGAPARPFIGARSGIGASLGPGSSLAAALHALGQAGVSRSKSTPREPVQMLDRPGVATLVRLLFFPQQLEKGVLQSLLRNLCDHPKSRIEIVNHLLLILQEGTKDNLAVDKSFSQMSSKASKAATPKSTPAKRKSDAPVASGGSSAPGLLHVPGENVPNLVAQRCLEAFKYLVASNAAVAQYFLTEQESLATLVRKSARKSIGGKGKEKAASASGSSEATLPLVVLLSLLERQSLLSSSAIMDALTSLLATVTKPLRILAHPAPKQPSEQKSQNSASGVDQGEQQQQQQNSADVNVGNERQPATETSAEAPQQSGSAQEQEQESAPPAQSSPKKDKSEKAQPQESAFEKQLRSAPPQLEPSSLAVVVNILDGDEVTSKTFRATLALISHLSTLPQARSVISNELIKRASQHGEALYPDLLAISKSLATASTQNDMPSSIVSRFSSASSLQAKLLRVLQTIHYIHSLKPEGSPQEEKDPETGMDATEAEVNNIYLSFDFASIWDTLSVCLTHIEDNNNLRHMGTVLLPLIESLMVVSRYAARPNPASATAPKPLRTAPLSPTTAALPAQSPLETLQSRFASFTQQHRKLLNSMVKNTPSLMGGSFAILVHNPAVLDFDNKVNYFNQRLHKNTQRIPSATLPVAVRRKYIFEDSFHHLGPARKSPEQIKYGKLAVRFYEEEGVDAGGVTREWYSTLARSIFNPNYALFQPSSSDQLVYQPNPHSYVNPDHLPFFTFVGRIIGKSIFDGRLLEAFFTKAFYKHLLGLPVDLRDLESVDPDNYRSLIWMLENSIDGILELTFSIEADVWGVQKVVDLKPGGRDIPVTDDNKREYVDLLVRHRLTDSIQEQIDAFKSGFTSIVPAQLVSIFNAYELQLLISGLPDIDVDEWRANTVYQNYTASASPIVWYWRAVRSFSSEERAKLLQFVTGSARVPLEGFGALQGVSGNTKFTITAAHKTDVLPAAHSCFNQLDLPNFTSYEELRRMLLLAITETEGFGFA